MLLVTREICKNIPSHQNYVQTNCSDVAPMLFKNIGITLQQFFWKEICRLGALFVGVFPALCSGTGAAYKQLSCSNDFSAAYRAS